MSKKIIGRTFWGFATETCVNIIELFGLTVAMLFNPVSLVIWVFILAVVFKGLSDLGVCV